MPLWPLWHNLNCLPSLAAALGQTTGSNLCAKGSHATLIVAWVRQALSATLSFKCPVALQLCYKFGNQPFKLVRSVKMHVHDVVEIRPHTNAFVAALPRQLVFSGVGVQSGDLVRWVTAGADCTSNLATLS